MMPPNPKNLASLEAQAREIARALKAGLPSGCGFFLLLFDFGDSGWMTYMSNGQRADMRRLLRELLEKLGPS